MTFLVVKTLPISCVAWMQMNVDNLQLSVVQLYPDVEQQSPKPLHHPSHVQQVYIFRNLSVKKNNLLQKVGFVQRQFITFLTFKSLYMLLYIMTTHMFNT